MRFDDSLKTVLAADTSSAFGAQSAFRQIVDLMGRGRIVPDDDTIAFVRALRAQVPESIRAASARALALADPPAPLVALFGEDEIAIAAPVLRIARLDDDAWAAILPRLGPAGRAILRARTDLSAAVERGLDSLGATDFTIAYDAPAEPDRDAARTVVPFNRPVAPPQGPGPFLSLGAVARDIPIVAEALRRSDPGPSRGAAAQGFEIAELVDRIETFQRERETGGPVTAPPAPAPMAFRFETDAAGLVRWVDGATRAAIVGLSLATGGAASQVDGVAQGAFRRRTGFRDARLTIAGEADVAGDWRISATPLFDRRSGRFLGMRGAARRPRPDEAPVPVGPNRTGAEALRRLVHELRTPTNAISGFAELIESEMLGTVAPVHRDRAGTIRANAADLVDAIDDLDTAARIESDAMELRPGTHALAPMIVAAREGVAQLAALRGCTLDTIGALDPLTIAADDRATARLIGRIVATLVSAGGEGERIVVTAAPATVAGDGAVDIAFTRPAALANVPEDALLSIDAEREVVGPGAPLLGTGFALRLARNLARELGGALTIAADRLTLRLPAGLNDGVQASNS